MASTVSSGVIFFSSTGALLITLFPQVDALRTCHFESECALRPNSKGVSQRNLQLNDVNDKAEAMEKCCTELQGATFFLDGCNPCKLATHSVGAPVGH